MLTAEAEPLIKVGGLADVLGALPAAIATLGHDVSVVLPHYGRIDDAQHAIQPLQTLSVPWGGAQVLANVAVTHPQGYPIYLISGEPMPRDERIYGSDIADDGPRFSFVARAALALAEALGTPPDILHVHDYHPGLALYWLAEVGWQQPFWQQTAGVITVHNLPFQGNHAQATLALLDLPLAPTHTGLPDWARAGLLPLALASAQMINAVSPGYAQEMLTEDYGAGLHPFLATRQARLTGILNGLHYSQWNPADDAALWHNFDADTLAERAANKPALQAAVGLPVENSPLLGIVSRLDHQKGFNLADAALRRVLLHNHAQVVVLGTGQPEIQAAFEALALDFPQQVAFISRYDGTLARAIYGACDIFLMPSRYEPCGTSQMLALRYGALPVVRATGGLRDTVLDIEAHPELGVGFVFNQFSGVAFADAIQRALNTYANPPRWQMLQQRGMALRFSWAKAAAHYAALYTQAQAHLPADQASWLNNNHH